MSHTPKFFGFGHYSRTGKDTVALAMKVIGEEKGLNVQIRPFAGKLKAVAHDLYGHLGLKDMDFYNTPRGEEYRDVKLPVINKTPVEIWIELGNLLRDVYQGTWIDYVMNANLEGVDIVIIPDVRFPNEVKAIQERGGFVCQVTRPGVKPRDSSSDRALLGFDGWDDYFHNDKGFESINNYARHLLVGYTGEVI